MVQPDPTTAPSLTRTEADHRNAILGPAQGGPGRPADLVSARWASQARPALTRACLNMEDDEHLTSRDVADLLLAAEGMPSPGERWAAERKRIGELTKREYEVFFLLGEGLDNHKISLSLGVGERTVKLHVTSILRKLTLESRLQAGLAAAEHALLAHFPKVQ